jgi:hypothetical protein
MNRENSLDPDPSRNLSDSERFPGTPVFPRNNDTFEHLDAFPVSLGDTYVHLDSIAGPEFRYILAHKLVFYQSYLLVHPVSLPVGTFILFSSG